MKIKKKPKKVLVQATIEPELADAIRKIAAANQVSVSQVVAHALSNLVDAM